MIAPRLRTILLIALVVMLVTIPLNMLVIAFVFMLVIIPKIICIFINITINITMRMCISINVIAGHGLQAAKHK